MFEIILTACIFTGFFSVDCKPVQSYKVIEGESLQENMKICKTEAEKWYIKNRSYASCELKGIKS